MRLLVLCPHFEPDTAPTGVIMSRVVKELGRMGHELHVVTALPWYRSHAVEPGWEGRWVRRQHTPWGSVTRVFPFPGSDKRNLIRRALGFLGFSLLVGGAALGAGGWRSRIDAVLVMSPPLTLGPTGWAVGLVRRAPMVFNVQDVFPDAAVATGAVTNPVVLALARWLERLTYRMSAAVTVLSDDLAQNVTSKLPLAHRARVHVIPNFVDTHAIQPGDRGTPYRSEHGIGTEPVVMYAGNVGLSQSLDLMLEAAARLPQVTFVINGEGAARSELQRRAQGLNNVRFVGFQAPERLSEVLASADVHVVALRRGLGRVSVPSKIYSILAAGRPVVAAIDPGTEVPRLLEQSGAGVAVPPDEPETFIAALAGLIDDQSAAQAMGAAGRAFVERHVSPSSVASRYADLLGQVAGDRRRRRRAR